MSYHPHPRAPRHKNSKLDFIVSIVAIASPLMTLPQVILIYSTRNADGVSALSWFSYVGASFVWLLYGFAHHQRPIIVNSFVGGVLSLAIAVGAFLYS